MSVYKVLVQKFNLGREEPFQMECIEVCADSFYVDEQGTLLFKIKTPFESVAAIPSGTWYRVQKACSDGTEAVESCECGCDETEAVEKALLPPVQVW